MLYDAFVYRDEPPSPSPRQHGTLKRIIELNAKHPDDGIREGLVTLFWCFPIWFIGVILMMNDPDIE